MAKKKRVGSRLIGGLGARQLLSPVARSFTQGATPPPPEDASLRQGTLPGL